MVKHIDIEEYIQTRVEDQIRWHDRKANDSKRAYIVIEWILIILASLTPIFVILNLSFSSHPLAPWIPVVSSSLVAMLTGGLKTFRYDETWKRYRDRVERLKKEKYQFMASAGIYKLTEDPNTLFIETIETILSR